MFHQLPCTIPSDSEGWSRNFEQSSNNPTSLHAIRFSLYWVYLFLYSDVFILFQTFGAVSCWSTLRESQRIFSISHFNSGIIESKEFKKKKKKTKQSRIWILKDLSRNCKEYFRHWEALKGERQRHSQMKAEIANVEVIKRFS